MWAKFLHRHSWRRTPSTTTETLTVTIINCQMPPKIFAVTFSVLIQFVYSIVCNPPSNANYFRMVPMVHGIKSFRCCSVDLDWNTPIHRWLADKSLTVINFCSSMPPCSFWICEQEKGSRGSVANFNLQGMKNMDILTKNEIISKSTEFGVLIKIELDREMQWKERINFA